MDTADMVKSTVADRYGLFVDKVTGVEQYQVHRRALLVGDKGRIV